MRIVVFVRPVQNPAVQIEPSSTRVLEELQGYAPMPNPGDGLALEMALRLREQASFPVRIEVCSVGGEWARKVLREFVACGADGAICIEEAGWEPDGAVTAACLSEFYRADPIDLCLFGARDLDTGAGEVGPMFAAFAGIPYIDSVVNAKWSEEGRLDVTRKEKRLREEIRVRLPACLGILRGASLRYPSFWGKLEAGASEIINRSPGDVQRTAKLERKKFSRPKPKRGSVANAYAESRSVDQMRQALGITGPGGQQAEDSVLKGDTKEAAERIVRILKEEKLIDLNPPSLEGEP